MNSIFVYTIQDIVGLVLLFIMLMLCLAIWVMSEIDSWRHNRRRDRLLREEAEAQRVTDLRDWESERFKGLK